MIRLKNILLEGMTIDVADTIFSKFGVENASSLDKGKLKDYYIALVKKYHPVLHTDSSENMQYINAAYDVLKGADPSHQVASSGIYPPHKTYPKDPHTKGMYTMKVTVEIRSVINGHLLYSGKCDRIDFMEIIRKLKKGFVYTEIEPENPYDYSTNSWRTTRVVLYVDTGGFSKIISDLEKHFR
jgi:hypothetical protein